MFTVDFDMPAVIIAVISPFSMILAFFIGTAVIIPTVSLLAKPISLKSESKSTKAFPLKSLSTFTFNIAFALTKPPL